jgi:hypothetical protein
MNPYIENEIDDNVVIRTFKDSTDSEDFKWHRDPEDRRVIAIEETDWEIQLDNELPLSLNKEVFIPKETFHRLIKGNGDLKIIVKKIIKNGAS